MHSDATTIVPGEDPVVAVQQRYDAIIVGAGIAGSALAASLGKSGRSVLLLERDLSPPDRIVGELLQPGGCLALGKLGLRSCLDGIEAVEVRGYKVFWADDNVAIPYPPEEEDRRMSWTDGTLWNAEKGERQVQEGRSFHHGRFVQRLRWHAKRTPGVVVMEAVVNDLIRCDTTDAVIGIQATPKRGETDAPSRFYAPLTFVVDGCFSKFRRELALSSPAPVVRSNFVGLILDTPAPHTTLPQPGHGHVILRKSAPDSQEDGVGPVLVYQIGKDDTRMLIDVPGPKIPSIGNGSLKAYLERHVTPILPSSLVETFTATLNSSDPSKRPRSMPNSYLPARFQGRDAEGVVMVGDAMNMRHPLTGGGMTVALNDVLILTELFGASDSATAIDLGDWSQVSPRLESWYWRRKGVATCINVLAQALYSLFGADDEHLEVLKTGCFKYFELGGIRISGPVSLLSALTPSPLLLFYHFFSVAFYSIYIMFTQSSGDRDRSSKGSPSPLEWPALTVKAIRVFQAACVVMIPVLWTNML